ncbi:hypothetical protein OG762_36775 [Streptomyces sp. NBC_01136]|uniref:DUF6197 family protein n=1 Tax=Streptomyces sp. NBC_01136 TaxID=2903754 RepID=UPI0038657C63|nr:hypothetical protein OG762_36775 [Streptomyces sp. NBC_01136]
MTTVTAFRTFTEADTAAAVQIAVAEARFWQGPSGELATGEQVARHLDATLTVLSGRGWARVHGDPDPEPPVVDEAMSTKGLLLCLLRWVRDMARDSGPLTLMIAMMRAQDAAGDSDTSSVGGRVMDALLRARTGALYVSHTAWAEKQGRTFDEVRDVLETAAAFARTHGPATTAGA